MTSKHNWLSGKKYLKNILDQPVHKPKAVLSPSRTRPCWNLSSWGPSRRPCAQLCLTCQGSELLGSRLILKPSLVWITSSLWSRRLRRSLVVILVPPISALFLILCLGCWRGNVAILSGGRDAAFAGLVENQHGRTSLEAGVSALAGPVAVARFPKGNIAVSVILAKG